MKNGQFRDTGNIDDETHSTICVGHHYAQTNTKKKKNANKTCAFIQTTLYLLCGYILFNI